MASTIEEIMDCLINPVKNKILASIDTLGQATGKQLMEIHKDIPQATLYRTLNRLEKAGIIEITAENRVRGAVEKVYEMNKKADILDAERIVKENDGKGYLSLFLSFAKMIMREFDLYVKRPDIDILHDGSGFTAIPICVTEEELQELAYNVSQVALPYSKNLPAPDRENHTMAIIYTPPKADSTNEERGDR